MISDGHTCPQCRSTDLSDDFSGIVFIEDPEKSQIANIIEVKNVGRYALRIR